jgi:hypothetical protein
MEEQDWELAMLNNLVELQGGLIIAQSEIEKVLALDLL